MNGLFAKQNILLRRQPENKSFKGHGVSKFQSFIIVTLLLSLSACGNISQSTSSPESSPTEYVSFRNSSFPFTFEYPALYEYASYRDSCGVSEISNGIHLGHEINIFSYESDGLNTTDFANHLLQSNGWGGDSLKVVTINGQDAVQADYRFGGTNRFGTFTLLKHNDQIITLNFTAGGFCDIPEAQITEAGVYAHILESFRLDP